MRLSILGRKRIWKNTLVWASILFVVYSITGFFILPLAVKALLIRQLSQRLHREVSIGKVRTNPFAFTVAINDFSILDVQPPAPFITFQRIDLNIQASSLFRGGIVLRQIRVIAPRIGITRRENLSYNFSDLLQAPSEQSPVQNEKSLKVSLNNIQVIDGNIEFVDMPKHTRHRMSDIQISIPFLSNFPGSVEIFTQPAFHANVDGTVITLNGRSKPFTDFLETSVNIQFQNLDLAKYIEYLPEDMDFRLKSGYLDSSIVLSFAQSRDQSPVLAVTGTMALRDLAITDPGERSLVKLELFEVRVASAVLFARNIRLDRILIKSPEVQLIRGKAGFVKSGLISPKPASASAPRSPSSNKSGGYIEAAEVKILDGRLTFRDESAGFSEEVSRVHELTVRNAVINLTGQNAIIDQITSQGGHLLLRRDRDGTLNVMKVISAASATLPAAQAESPKDRPSASSSMENPWTITLRKLLLDQYSVRYEDYGHSSPAIWDLNPVHLTAENLSTAPASHGNMSLRLNIGKTGVFAADGAIAFNPVRADISLSLKRLSLSRLQPYISDRLKMTVTGGNFSTRGRLNLALNPKTGFTARFRGEAGLRKFGTIEDETGDELLKWESLLAHGIETGYHPFYVQIREIRLADLFARIAIHSDGQLNLKEIVKAEPDLPDSGEVPSVTAPSRTSARSGGPVSMRIDRVAVQNGRIQFTDHYVEPMYNTALTGLNGTVSGLSSIQDQQADLTLSCKQDDSAPVAISGKINPLGKKIYLNLKFDTKAIEMSPFTPYSGKYAGYAIQKGKLSLDLKYKIEDRALDSENDILLDQFTLGEKIDSPEATQLPVSLAVSLLTDRNGQIHLSLPVAGSLDDPKFKIWRIVIQVIRNILVKAATSPFALLSALAGGHEELSYVEFEYGKTGLNNEARNRISQLARALYERPAIRLEISGSADPDHDREALRQFQFQRRLKAQKLNDLIRKGEAVPSVDDVTIGPDEYLTYLTKAYKKEKFSKPRNFLGFAKEIPGPDMERLMLANTEVTDEDLRNLASSRALSVKDAFLGTGQIGPERLFLVERTSPAGEQKEHANLSRVDFTIK